MIRVFHNSSSDRTSLPDLVHLKLVAEVNIDVLGIQYHAACMKAIEVTQHPIL